jgi:hypothetical protein
LKGHIVGRIEAFNQWKANIPPANYRTPVVVVGGFHCMVEVRLITGMKQTFFTCEFGPQANGEQKNNSRLLILL